MVSFLQELGLSIFSAKTLNLYLSAPLNADCIFVIEIKSLCKLLLNDVLFVAVYS